MIYQFRKYQATGNDFVMMDDRKGEFPAANQKLIQKLCDRNFGIGGDGLILLREDQELDFKMIYFNADGREGTMCGNGGRAAILFAHNLNLCRDSKVRFQAIDGAHEGYIDKNIRLKMKNVDEIRPIETNYFINTGSPHFVQFHPNLESLDVVSEGRKIRHQGMFQPEGVNVNFVDDSGNTLYMRTYERGVENETLSCGTGSVAVAIAADQKHKQKSSSYTIMARGGQLKVFLQLKPNNSYTDIWLEGPAEEVFTGSINI
jgi:diaminopimelate epimerase